MRNYLRYTHNTGTAFMSDFSQEEAGPRTLVYMLLKTFSNNSFYTATFSQVTQTRNSLMTNDVNSRSSHLLPEHCLCSWLQSRTQWASRGTAAPLHYCGWQNSPGSVVNQPLQAPTWSYTSDDVSRRTGLQRAHSSFPATTYSLHTRLVYYIPLFLLATILIPLA